MESCFIILPENKTENLRPCLFNAYSTLKSWLFCANVIMLISAVCCVYCSLLHGNLEGKGTRVTVLPSSSLINHSSNTSVYYTQNKGKRGWSWREGRGANEEAGEEREGETKHKQKQRACLLNMYVSFLVFQWAFVLQGCSACRLWWVPSTNMLSFPFRCLMKRWTT